jgi:hypothetical protein
VGGSLFCHRGGFRRRRRWCLWRRRGIGT